MKSLNILLLSLFLTACSTTGSISSINLKEKEIVVISIPDDLLTSCKPNKPITKEEYLSLSLMQREAYLTNYSIELLTELKKCDIKIEQIRKIKEKYNEGKQ